MTEDAHKPVVILVVEDEFIIAMDVHRFLEQEGYEVVGPAASVGEALGLLEKSTPDACVLDANLRGEQSGPVAAALRARNIPFLISSAYEQRDLDQFFAFAGAQHVGKLATPRELLAALVELLAN